MAVWGRNKGSVPARFLVRELASGEGPGAEEQEVDGSYLWAAVVASPRVDTVF